MNIEAEMYEASVPDRPGRRMTTPFPIIIIIFFALITMLGEVSLLAFAYKEEVNRRKYRFIQETAQDNGS